MTGWIILGIIVAIVLYLFMSYNGLVSMRQRTNQAFADIDVQLKQRHDLIPNLIETVKGYASHERETLDAVIKARNSAMSAAPQSAAQAQSEGMLSAALGRLIALSEAYPDLKANTNFLKLQEDLGDVENKLSAARRFFNNAVGEYNAAIESVPAVFYSKSFGFVHREFFDLGDEKRTQMDEPPKVSFNG